MSSVAEVLAAPFLVAPSREIAQQKSEMEGFLFENVYRHPKIMAHRNRVRSWLESLFDYYLRRLDVLPSRYEFVAKTEGNRRAVCDCLSDLTDRSARLEHLRLIENRETVPQRPLDRTSMPKRV